MPRDQHTIQPDGWHVGLGVRTSLAQLNVYSGTTLTDGIKLPGAATRGVSVTGACTTAISVTGACTTGLLIAAATGKCISFAGSFSGAASASGLLMGVGTDLLPATTATADAKFIELRCQTTATSGDNRLVYLRYDQNGASGGGECLRARTYGTAALGTARGGHISLEFSDDGSISGLGVGCDGQLMINDALPAGGTYYAGQSEMYMTTAASSVAATTKHAVHSFNCGGHATGAATVRNLFHIGTVSVDAGTDLVHMVTTGCGQAALDTATTAAARILVGNTTYWIPLATEIEAD